MPTFTPVRLFLFLLSAAIVLAPPAPALAEEMAAPPPETMPPQAGPPPNFECAAEPVTGTGPGFSSSRDASEEAAREAWLEKAKAIYPEAAWERAWQANLSCVVQGLYSKCFAQGIPCRLKPEGADEDASADEAGDAEAPDESAQAPKAE